MIAFGTVRIRVDARSRRLKASMLRWVGKKPIRRYIYDLMRQRTPYGTILTLFSNSRTTTRMFQHCGMRKGTSIKNEISIWSTKAFGRLRNVAKPFRDFACSDVFGIAHGLSVFIVNEVFAHEEEKRNGKRRQI